MPLTFSRTRNPTRALCYSSLVAAVDAVDEYYHDTGRTAEVRPFRRALFRLVDVADEQLISRNPMNTYTFPDRPIIRTEHDPIAVGDYVDGRFSENVTEVVTYDDDYFAAIGRPRWNRVYSARRLMAGYVELTTSHGSVIARDDFVVFGIARA